MGSQVFFTGSYDISGFNGDEGTVGVGNQTGVSGGVGYGGNRGSGGETMGGKVFSLGGSEVAEEVKVEEEELAEEAILGKLTTITASAHRRRAPAKLFRLNASNCKN